MSIKQLIHDIVPDKLQQALQLQIVEGDAEFAKFSAVGHEYELRLLQSDQVYFIRVSGAKREFVGTYPVAYLASYLEQYVPATPITAEVEDVLV